IRFIFCKLIPAPSAGRHGNGPRAERSAACNVARRIANNVDLFCGELATMLLFCPGTRESPELIPIPMIVGKSAKFKKMPDAVVLEFQSRSAGNISGEQREHQTPPRLELFEQLKQHG